MNLTKKKALASRALGAGKGRIMFNRDYLPEIKEAITKQDMRDLLQKGAIIIKNNKGRRKVEKRKHRRGEGKVRKRIKTGKQDYTRLVRKLRSHLFSAKKSGKTDAEKYPDIRKKIKAKHFKNIAQLKEYLNAK